MKRVLWVSRHEMTGEQFADLERVMGDAVELLLWTDTVSDPAELAEPLAAVDAAAVVLPPELLGDVLALAGGKSVLRAISLRRPTGRTVTLPDGRREREFAFVHGGWERILRAEFVTARL